MLCPKYPKIHIKEASAEDMKSGIIGKIFVALILFPAFFLVKVELGAAALIADHNIIAEFENILTSYIETVDDSFHIYYVHTSHGSQIVTGISMIYNDNSLYTPPCFFEVSDDLGHNGDTTWVPATRLYLFSIRNVIWRCFPGAVVLPITLRKVSIYI